MTTTRQLLKIVLFLTCWQAAAAQKQPHQTDVDQIVGRAKDLNLKNVSARGYLRIMNQPKHGPLTMLFETREKAVTLSTQHSLLVIPTHQMLADAKMFDTQYVELVGTIHSVPTTNGSYIPVLKDLKSYALLK